LDQRKEKGRPGHHLKVADLGRWRLPVVVASIDAGDGSRDEFSYFTPWAKEMLFG
jgi:hypothetical protein